ncbi:MAG: ubiquinone/menaquinone biosynthesis methyltransferase [Thermoanaerobaculia bacterium]
MLDKDPRQIRRMFASVSHRYDVANRVLSMRFDVAWRKRVAGELLPAPGGLVLDLAAGTGDLTVDLERFGGHKVVSADFTFEMLAHGREKLRSRAPGAIQVTADALSLPFASETFDGVSVAFGVRNFQDPGQGLREIRRVLKGGGQLGVLEFSKPRQPIRFFYGLYSRHILPAVGGLITGTRSPYEYLPASVQAFPEGDAFLGLMREAGFRNSTAARLSGGIVTFYRGEA